MFHNHEKVSDDQMKDMLKEMLDKDKECVSYLDELKKKGVTYDKLWYEKLYSKASIFIIYIKYIN